MKQDVLEVVVPAFEGEMGILKDHISIISFLKPGIIKIYSKSGDSKFCSACRYEVVRILNFTGAIGNSNELQKHRSMSTIKSRLAPAGGVCTGSTIQ